MAATTARTWNYDAMQNGRETVFDEICKILQRYNPDGLELSAATDLNADLNIDSVAAMDLIMEIEDRFEIDIPINLLSELRNLQDLVDIVRKQREGV
jgi:acyl carrier protein